MKLKTKYQWTMISLIAFGVCAGWIIAALLQFIFGMLLVSDTLWTPKISYAMNALTLCVIVLVYSIVKAVMDTGKKLSKMKQLLDAEDEIEDKEE